MNDTMNDIRCPVCRKNLFKSAGNVIEIKCLRCRKVTAFENEGGLYVQADQGMVSAADDFFGDRKNPEGLQETTDNRDQE